MAKICLDLDVKAYAEKAQKPVPVTATTYLDLEVWIEVQLEDETGQPVLNQPFTVIDRVGKQYKGVTGASGIARVEGISAGTCRISFTHLDKNLWAPRGATLTPAPPNSKTRRHKILPGENLACLAEQNRHR